MKCGANAENESIHAHTLKFACVILISGSGAYLSSDEPNQFRHMCSFTMQIKLHI